MSEQLLDDAQVGAALEQMGREAVPQRVRTDPLGQAGPCRCALDARPGLLPRQPPAAIAEEQRPAARRPRATERDEADPRAVDPATEPVERDIADRHEALL